MIIPLFTEEHDFMPLFTEEHDYEVAPLIGEGMSVWRQNRREPLVGFRVEK